MSTLEDIKKRDIVIELVCRELESAVYKYGDFKSAHDGYSIILEELDELWDLIKTNQGNTNRAKKEAIQIAAMAIKYAMSYGTIK